jgi:hypothetical protein
MIEVQIGIYSTQLKEKRRYLTIYIERDSKNLKHHRLQIIKVVPVLN